MRRKERLTPCHAAAGSDGGPELDQVYRAIDPGQLVVSTGEVLEQDGHGLLARSYSSIAGLSCAGLHVTAEPHALAGIHVVGSSAYLTPTAID